MKNIERIRSVAENDLVELLHEMPFDCAERCPDFGLGCLGECTHDAGRDIIREWLETDDCNFKGKLSMTENKKIESALLLVGRLKEMMNGQYPGDFRTIREAVKKQMPKEIGELYKSEIEELPGKFILSGNCPICGSAVHKKHVYCWNCGQRIKWPEDQHY